MTKCERLVDGDWQAFRYPNTYSREHTTGADRLRIAPSGDHADLVLALASGFTSEFKILYVLHTPRGGSRPGRYESAAVGESQLAAFFKRFGAFFAGDGRHDIWVHAADDSSTIVWDRHDLLYAYGPLPDFEAVLERYELRPGPAVQIPSPHSHTYHAEWDAAERELVHVFDWRVTPLRETDQQ
jgi:hypothetical protein